MVPRRSVKPRGRLVASFTLPRPRFGAGPQSGRRKRRGSSGGLVRHGFCGMVAAMLGAGAPDASVRADAIVVLGCRIAVSGRLCPPAARRAAAAAAAYRDGVAPLVVASGGKRWGSQIEARAFGRALVEAGVPARAIVEELVSLSTVENAVCSAALLRRLGAKRAAIVTCSWHMHRALEAFRKAGVEVTGIPAPAGDLSLRRRLYLGAHELVAGLLDAEMLRHTRLGELVA